MRILAALLAVVVVALGLAAQCRWAAAAATAVEKNPKPNATTATTTTIELKNTSNFTTTSHVVVLKQHQHKEFFSPSDSTLVRLNSWARGARGKKGGRGGRGRASRGPRSRPSPKGQQAPRRNPFKQMAISKYIIVDQSGHGNFRSIQAAVDSIPIYNRQWIYVQINAGLYREKVIIPYNKPLIIFQGAGRERTVITWSDSASRSGTADSATFTAWAPSFIAKGISFKNGSPPPPPGSENRQAVAALAAADQQAFYSCGFYGAQDTLFDYQGRHYFRDCYIEGSIDVIFGHAQSIFRECELHSIAQSYGSLAAHNRWNPNDNSGFVFVDCSITGSTGQVFLGRAWGAYSRIIYINTRMDNVIMPEGWYDWGVAQRQRTVFFGQYKCSGPGASEAGRVSWSHELNDWEARPFTQINFINGQEWLSEI